MQESKIKQQLKRTEGPFTFAGKHYTCVEQYMMAQKVWAGRRYDLFEKIMKATDPAEMKALAGKDSFPEFAQIPAFWEKNRFHIVKRGVKAKFQQNSDMRKELLDTGNALLCECAGQDTIWGISLLTAPNTGAYAVINTSGLIWKAGLLLLRWVPLKKSVSLALRAVSSPPPPVY